MTAANLQPIAVPSEAGEVLELLGVRHKLTERHTGGAIYLFESQFGPDAGNALHRHQYEDELAYVLEGVALIRLGDRDLELTTGGIAFLPKGIPHAIHNPLAAPSRYLFGAIPGGSLERCFEAVQSAAVQGSLDEQRRREIFLRYGVEFVD